jgi:hypothetical protein
MLQPRATKKVGSINQRFVQNQVTPKTTVPPTGLWRAGGSSRSAHKPKLAAIASKERDESATEPCVLRSEHIRQSIKEKKRGASPRWRRPLPPVPSSLPRELLQTMDDGPAWRCGRYGWPRTPGSSAATGV